MTGFERIFRRKRIKSDMSIRQLAQSQSASGERPSSAFARSVELSSSFADASIDKGDERTLVTLGRLYDTYSFLSDKLVFTYRAEIFLI